MITNTYWNHTGKFEKEAALLRTLIPLEGSVTSPRSRNKALEKFRKASNCYYDLHNNGLCNRAAEFNAIFGINSSWHRIVGQHRFFEHLYEETESAMDEIVKAAAIEQGIMQANLHIIA